MESKIYGVGRLIKEQTTDARGQEGGKINPGRLWGGGYKNSRVGRWEKYLGEDEGVK
jgi:hypothetical protein